MNTGAGVVRILALLLVCGAAGGARGRACTGDQTTPEITIDAQYDQWYQYQTPYGKDLIINCSSKSAANLKIEEDGNQLQTVKVNITTFEVRVKKPDIGSYTYSCTDKQTSGRHSLTVTVHPAMYVESTRVQHRLDRWGDNVYLVPLGEYSIFCSGQDAGALTIEDEHYEPLQTVAVNSSTVKYKKLADGVGETVYNCQSKITTIPGAGMYGRILVTVSKQV